MQKRDSLQLEKEKAGEERKKKKVRDEVRSRASLFYGTERNGSGTLFHGTELSLRMRIVGHFFFFL